MSVRLMSMAWQSGLPKNQKILLLAYADHANDDGSSIYPGEDLVAEKTSDSKGNVRRVTKLLLESGILIQTKPGYRGQRAEYLINVAALEEQIASHIARLSENGKGAHHGTERRANIDERRASMSRKASRGATPNHQEPSEPSGTISARKRNHIFDWFVDRFNMPTSTETQTRRIGKLVAETKAVLDEEGAVCDDPSILWSLDGRAQAWPNHFPGATLTPEAYAKWVSTLGRPPIKGDVRDQSRAALESLK